MNEAQIAVRDKVKSILHKFDNIFIAYNKQFDGIDNVEYFDSTASSLQHEFAFTQIKDQHRRAWFLMGSKR